LEHSQHSIAEILPYLLLGADSEKSAYNISRIIAINSTGRYSLDDLRPVNTSDLPTPREPKNAISTAFAMIRKGCKPSDIASYLFYNTTPREALAANLVYATILKSNVGAWRKLVSNYLAAYDLQPSLHRNPQNVHNRLNFLSHQFSSAKLQNNFFCKENLPLVSVIVSIFNSQSTLEYSIQSLMRQTYHNLEILIVNDASTDNSLETIESLANTDERIRIISLAENCGPYVCRNIALRYATGIFVTCQDADDWSHPRRIERQMQSIISSDCQANMCYMLRVGPDGRFTRSSPINDICIDGILRLCFSSLLIRREYLTTTYGGWDNVRKAADSELVYRLKSYDNNCLTYTEEPLVIALDSPFGLSSDLSDLTGLSSNTKINDRGFYLQNFKEWHCLKQHSYPFLTSGKFYDDLYVTNPAPFRAPRSFAVPQSVKISTLISREKALRPKHVGSKSASTTYHKFRENSIVEHRNNPPGLLWHFIAEADTNPSLFNAIMKDKMLVKDIASQAKRFGFFGLTYHILDRAEREGIDLGANLSNEILIASELFQSFGVDISSVRSSSVAQLLYIHRDVLAMKRVRTNGLVCAADSIYHSQLRPKNPVKLALLIQSLGAGGAEKQFIEWCRFLQTNQDSSFEVYALIMSSSKNHFKQALLDCLPASQIFFLDEVRVNDDQDITVSIHPSMYDLAHENLKYVNMLTSATRIRNIKRLSYVLNSLETDGLVSFLEEPFISGLFACSLGRQIKCLSRFGSMPRLIGRDLDFPDKLKARIRSLLYSTLPECPTIGIGANSARCLHEYHRIFNAESINRSRYYHLPNVIAKHDSGGATAIDIPQEESEVYEYICRMKRDTPGSVVVGAVMRLSEEKNPLLYLQTAKRLASCSAVFVIIGSGPLLPEVNRFLQRYSNPFICHVSSSLHLDLWYDLIDILCLTSNVEGSPNVLIEGALHECAIVATDVGGVTECFKHNSSALICEPASLDSIASSVSRLINESALRLGLAARAVEVVSSKHSGESLMASLQSFFCH
jgi:glycosyltransferase involved in cell wall biosynthesis